MRLLSFCPLIFINANSESKAVTEFFRLYATINGLNNHCVIFFAGECQLISVAVPDVTYLSSLCDGFADKSLKGLMLADNVAILICNFGQVRAFMNTKIFATNFSLQRKHSIRRVKENYVKFWIYHIDQDGMQDGSFQLWKKLARFFCITFVIFVHSHVLNLIVVR